jgi:glycerol-3-phosphate dehydrogenase
MHATTYTDTLTYTQAVLQLDLDQLKLVYEALHERDRLLSNAAHLARPLPILTVGSAEVQM